MKRTWVAMMFSLTAVGALAASPSDQPRVILKTNAGDLVLRLDHKNAPKHVEQVLRLVELGAYDTTDFFRIEPDFLIQLTEVDNGRLTLSEEQKKAVQALPLERNTLGHRRGALTMAREDKDPNSGRSSFSILLGDAPHLDGKYTVFGELESGFDVIEEMLRVPRSDHAQPNQRIEVLRAEVIPPGEILDPYEINGPKPLVPYDSVASATTVRLLPGAIVLIILISLGSFSLGGRVSPKVHQSLALLSALVGGFGLLVYSAPNSSMGHLHAVGAMLAVLAALKLTGRFEYPSEPSAETRTRTDN